MRVWRGPEEPSSPDSRLSDLLRTKTKVFLIFGGTFPGQAPWAGRPGRTHLPTRPWGCGRAGKIPMLTWDNHLARISLTYPCCMCLSAQYPPFLGQSGRPPPAGLERLWLRIRIDCFCLLLAALLLLRTASGRRITYIKNCNYCVMIWLFASSSKKPQTRRRRRRNVSASAILLMPTHDGTWDSKLKKTISGFPLFTPCMHVFCQC